jgi:haloalkane dehalogenase
MTILKTPEERFQNLPDYPFTPHYQTVGNGLQMHYIDEGPADAPIVLMMHGEPTWSFLYRKMIPIFVEAGFRAIAPDLIGFGKSDKILEKEYYSYASHVGWITDFIKALDLQNINLVCQDWGGLIGLRVAAENPERFVRISASNTGLPTGDQGASDAFKQWLTLSQSMPVFPTGVFVGGGCFNKLSKEEQAAYDAPFPDESYKTAARLFPILVPISPDNPATEANRAAWKVLSQWTKPFLTAFSDSDPITKGGDIIMQKMIPGTANQNHIVIEKAGHFVQEDKGEEWANAVVDFIKKN